jgi:repressor LexA
MGTEGATKYVDNTERFKKVPIIGTIACGNPILAQEYIEGYEYVRENVKVDFCLRAKGDSMIGARILDGDIVYVRKQPGVENGEIAVVLIDMEEATLKRVYKLDGTIILRAENPNFPDKVFNKKEARAINIIGKAILFRSEVR